MVGKVHGREEFAEAVHGRLVLVGTPTPALAYEFLGEVGAIEIDPDVDLPAIGDIRSLCRAIAAPLLVDAVQAGFAAEDVGQILEDAVYATFHGSLLGLEPLARHPALLQVVEDGSRDPGGIDHDVFVHAAYCVAAMLSLSVPEADTGAGLRESAVKVAIDHPETADPMVYQDPVLFAFDVACRLAPLWGIDTASWMADVPDDGQDEDPSEPKIVLH